MKLVQQNLKSTQVKYRKALSATMDKSNCSYVIFLKAETQCFGFFLLFLISLIKVAFSRIIYY